MTVLKLKLPIGIRFFINPSSPKGGLYQPPPNGYRPGAQNRTAKV